MRIAKYAHAEPAADRDVILTVKTENGNAPALAYTFRLSSALAQMLLVELRAAVNAQSLHDDA